MMGIGAWLKDFVSMFLAWMAIPSVTDWIMCILTLVYVVATVRILRSNKQSADAATEQIDATRRIQKQNVALQLLEQRFDIYRTISSWLSNAKFIANGDMHFKDSLPRLQALIFNNAADNVLEKTRRIEVLRSELESDTISEDERREIAIEESCLEQDVFLGKLASLSEEEKIIELAEVCYELVDYATIKAFADAYINIAIFIGSEIEKGGPYTYANELKRCTQRMLDAQILEKMKEEMKGVRE